MKIAETEGSACSATVYAVPFFFNGSATEKSSSLTPLKRLVSSVWLSLKRL